MIIKWKLARKDRQIDNRYFTVPFISELKKTDLLYTYFITVNTHFLTIGNVISPHVDI